MRLFWHFSHSVVLHMRNPRARKIIIQHNFALLKSQLGLRFQLNFSVVHALIPGNWGTIIKEHEQHNRWAATNSPDDHHHLGTTRRLLFIFPRFSLCNLFHFLKNVEVDILLSVKLKYLSVGNNLKEMYEHVSVISSHGRDRKSQIFYALLQNVKKSAAFRNKHERADF